MPMCLKCGDKFANCIKVEGKKRNLSKRKYCLACSPFGERNRRQLHLPPKIRKKYDHKHNCQYKMRKKRRKVLLDFRDSKCELCGYKKCRDILEFHHIESKKKSFNLTATSMSIYSWHRVLKEFIKTAILCPNCHGEVHMGLHKPVVDQWIKRSKDKGYANDIFGKYINIFPVRKKRWFEKICKHCEKDFYTEYKRSIFCSSKCAGLSTRKVVRPDIEQLRKEIRSFTWVGLGRKYGVSDNAVRKWAKNYNLIS